MARTLGAVLAVGAVLACVQYQFSTNHYREAVLFAVACVAWLVAGVALALGLLDTRPLRRLQGLLFFVTSVISVAVYAAGAPGAGMLFYYLWVTPYAYVFFSRLQAAAQSVVVGACVIAVEVAQVHQHPQLGPLSGKVPQILGVLTSLLVMGALARRLAGNAREADSRFRSGFDLSPVGLAFLSRDGRWLDVNDALCRMVGRPRLELLGRPVSEVFAEPLPETVLPETVLPDTVLPDTVHSGRKARSAEPTSAEFTSAVLRPDRREAWVSGTVVPVHHAGGDGSAYLQVSDVTDRRRDREALLHQARRDPLTGLANRAVFLDSLAEALAEDPDRRDLAVVLLDFDRFKIINDSLGHHIGDELLLTVAPRLSAALVPGDLLARLGGDEFVVLCRGVAQSLDALERASRLLQVMSDPIELASGSHVVSASIGVALADGAGDTVSGLLANADAAMYRAKALGRGRIEIFDAELRTLADERLRLEHDLRSSLLDGQFFLEYQPVVDSRGRTRAMEALVRWRSPERGVLGPDDFIALAEETGMICDIGNWVLATACADLVRWQAAAPADGPPITVTVNVSARQLSQADFVTTVTDILTREGVATGTLALEITESVLAASDQAWHTQLLALKKVGVRLLLDDFGTGYSSLAYLKRFPVDGVKIDRSFVVGLGSPEETAIVEAVIRLADALQLDVVAEGVETEEQLLRLRAMGCDMVQGFAISRPLPSDDVASWLTGSGEVRLA